MNIRTSIRRLSLLFIALFIGLSGGLVYWQVVVAQQVTTNIHNSRHCTADSAPIRGRIFDRNGVLLAESKPSRNAPCGYLRHYYYHVSGPNGYNVPSLAPLIGYYISSLYPPTGIEKQYDQYLSGGTGLTLLNNTINQTLHRPPVGDDIYLTIDVRIQNIVEKYFDEIVPQSAGNTFETHSGSVIVTNPHTGEILAMVSRSGIVTDPKTGDILTQPNPNGFPGYDSNGQPVGVPGYDVNRIAAGDLKYFQQLETDPRQPLLERPINARYVPGSTYKTVTLLAGLDSGSVTLQDTFDRDHALGPVIIGPSHGSSSSVCIVIPPQACGDGQEMFGPRGNNIEGYTKRYPINLNYGFSHSDNIIFAQVGAKTGPDKWLDYNKRFYVGQQIPFDLPVAVSRVLPPGKTQLAINQLAENAFGQGADFVTPFQMSLFDDAIANNGTLMKPWLVWKIVDPNGTVLQTTSPQQLGAPISDTTASQMRDGMYGVVRCGSGSIVPKLYGSPAAIIAKTGTGEVGGGKAAMAWLVTQAPYRNPQLTIVAMKEHGGEGGYVDGPMVADMYDSIFNNPDIAKELNLQMPPPPDPQNPYCFQNGLLQA